MEHNFWTHDYASGVDALFARLSQGVEESARFASMVASRAKIARVFAGEMARLAQEPLHTSAARSNSRIQELIGGCSSEAVTEAVLNTKIGDDLDAKVFRPLQRALTAHKSRLNELHHNLHSQIEGYHKRVMAAKKQRALYYDKCRKNEDEIGIAEAAHSGLSGSPGADRYEPVVSTLRGLRDMYVSPVQNTSSTTLPANIEIAGLSYSKSSFGGLIDKILGGVAIGEYRVPLIGPYVNVSTGASIAAASRRHLRNDSIAYSEKFGQALVDKGLLRPVGQLSNKFQSTQSSHYQWQPLAFELSTVVEPEEFPTGSSNSSLKSYSNASDLSQVSQVSQMSQMSQITQSSRRSEQSRLSHRSEDNGVFGDPDVEPSYEASHEGEQYLQAVLELDMYRCNMESDMEKVFSEVHQLERKRIEITSKALVDYAKLASRPHELADIQRRLISGVPNLNLDQEIDNFVREYCTGPLVPSVMVYRGFHDNVCQTFGVDLKHSAYFVPLVLEYLEPLTGSEPPSQDLLKLEHWIEPQPLEELYKLRSQMNTGKPLKSEQLFKLFKFFTTAVVVGCFKQYLLELPESLVPFTVYDKLKAAYEPNDDEEKDMDEIISSLMLLPSESRQTLQTLTKFLAAHYTHDDERQLLAKSLSLAVMRPRAVSALSTQDTHPQKLLYDLISEGDALFERVESRLQNQPAKAIPSSRPRRHVSTPITQIINERNPDSILITPTRVRTPDAASPSSGSPTTPSGLKPLTLSPKISREKTLPSRGLSISSLPVAKIPHRSVSGLPTRSADQNTTK